MNIARDRAPWLKALLAILLLATLTACATFRPLPPEVSVDSVRLLDMGFAEQKFGLMLRIRNPNDREFALNGLDYQLMLGGAPFAQGVLDRQVSLAARGETVIEVPFNIRLRDFLNSAVGKLLAGVGPAGRGQLDYRLTGQARIDGTWAVPFDRSGQIDLQKAVERAKNRK